MKQTILGMLAHVDAGKTTLTESLLFATGAISALGRVDHGTAFLDTDLLEKSRGITIYAKEARLFLSEEGREITLLDTPGHVDFSPEMERSLSVLDYGVLVISATDGVQSHTETVWRLLRGHKIPTFIFVNKMDLPDVEVSEIMEEITTRLDPRCVDFTHVTPSFGEEIGICDESLWCKFQENNTLSEGDIRQGIWDNLVFPCYFGSALKMTQIQDFLQGIATYTCSTEENNHQFAGKIFKITRDSQQNRLTHLKVTSGALAVKDILEIGGKKEKINEIRLYSGGKYESVHSVGTGTICAVTGLMESRGGMVLGTEKPSVPPSLSPVLTYTLLLPEKIDPNFALPLLKQLEEEDPALVMQWLEEGQSIQVQIMGDVQLEVLSSVILQRFGFAVEFGERDIIYRETLAQDQLLEGVGHFEPLRHYAEVQVHISPLPPDSGMVFEVDCPSHILAENYQHLVLTHLKEGVLRGTLMNAPLTDLKITLKSGRAHQKHSVGGDFREATLRAVRNGLLQGVSVLLEPWCKVELELPNDNCGRAMSDFQRMGGNCDIHVVGEQSTSLIGTAPLSALGNYATTVTAYTSGLGRCQISFLGYRPCQNTASVLSKVKYDGFVGGDSVFCKHGAGYSVPWDEVKNHMHCQSTLPKEEVSEEIPVHRQKKQHYSSTQAEDKALLEIFQRTYGKIPPQKLQSTRKTTTTALHQKPQKMKAPFLLVDGYNIIFAWDDLAEIARENLDSARMALINALCNYQSYYQCPVLVVFDAYQVKGGVGGVEQVHNITVVYTKEAETADMYIEKATRELASGYLPRVATSDGLIQLIILGQGGLRVSARSLYEEMRDMHRGFQKYLK